LFLQEKKELIGSFLLILLLLGCIGPPAVVSQELSWERVALSPSPFARFMLEQGQVYTDSQGRLASDLSGLVRLFKAHGATEVYARIATGLQYSGTGSDHSLSGALVLARASVEADLNFNPELGVFRAYGDVSCQPGPDFSGYPIAVPNEPWHELTLEEMLPVLRDYGAFVARKILATGARVEIWNLGNEINFGFAGVAPRPLPWGCPEEGRDWYRPPDGIDTEIGQTSILKLILMPAARRMQWLQLHVWPHEARLLAALASGVRSADPNAKFATHVTFPEKTEDILAFYRAMDAGGMQFDQLGLSVYVTSASGADARWEDSKQTVEALGREFARPIFVAEVAYPAGRTTWLGPYADWDHPVSGYPLSEKGQADFLCQLVRWGAAHGVVGIRPWAPDLVMFGWSPFALFRKSGEVLKARPALDSLTPACN